MSLRNRLANATNQWQGDAKRVLCVCSAGLLRSPTLAGILAAEPFNFNTRAVGAVPDFALVPLDEVAVFWADEIVVMNDSQAEVVRAMRDRIEEEFAIPCCPLIHVIDVPDNFAFRDPRLVEILTEKAHEIFD